MGILKFIYHYPVDGDLSCSLIFLLKSHEYLSVFYMGCETVDVGHNFKCICVTAGIPGLFIEAPCSSAMAEESSGDLCRVASLKDNFRIRKFPLSSESHRFRASTMTYFLNGFNFTPYYSKAFFKS